MTTPQQNPLHSSQDPNPTPNPLMDWVLANKVTLAVFLTAVAVIAVMQDQLPKRAEANRRQSWELHGQAIKSLETGISASRIPSILELTREDDRVHPWVVARMVQMAFFQGDRESLQALQPEVDRLVSEGSLSGVRVAKDGQAVDILVFLKDQMNAELSQPEIKFSNPEPTGQKVKLTLAADAENSYEITLGLYPDAAPETCKAFLEAVSEGRLVDQEIEFQGEALLRATGMAKEDQDQESDEDSEEEPNSLPLEVKWGYFHYQGALTTQTLIGAESGGQDPDVFSIQLQDQNYSDGNSTVFGKVVEGMEELESLRALIANREEGSEETAPKISAAEILP